MPFHVYDLDRQHPFKEKDPSILDIKIRKNLKQHKHKGHHRESTDEMLSEKKNEDLNILLSKEEVIDLIEENKESWDLLK